jgi:hypothetical protein
MQISGKSVKTEKVNLRFPQYFFQFWSVMRPNFIPGNLHWERDIPQDALNNLQNLANTDFHQNLGKIIHDIYLTAHNLFMDMPQGKNKFQILDRLRLW